MSDSSNAAVPRLVVTAGREVGRSLPLEHSGEFAVGRAPDAALVLSDPTVSRHHAVVRRDHDELSIVDVGSRSGTLVNGTAVTGSQHVVDGDEVALGAVTLRVEHPLELVGSGGGPGRPRIFMCYRREDAGGFARALYDELADRYGESAVFRDLDALAPGEDYTDRIDEAIATCDVALILIGGSWATATDDAGHRRLDDPDDLLVREVAAALAPERTVIPVLIESAVMPAERELPPSIVGLARRNAIAVSDARWRPDVDRLCDAIGPPSGRPSMPSDTGAVPVPTPPERVEPRPPSVAVRVTIAIAMLAVLGGVGIYFATRSGGDHPTPALRLEPPGRGQLGLCVTATATGFTPGASVRFTAMDRQVGASDECPVNNDGTVTVADDGTAALRFYVPDDCDSVQYVFLNRSVDVRVEGVDGSQTATAKFETDQPTSSGIFARCG